MLLLRRLNGLETDDAYLEALVDSILVPALRASPSAPRALPTGIFSGSPSLHRPLTSEGSHDLADH